MHPQYKKAVQKYDLKIIENPKPVTNRTSYCQQKSKCLLDENCLSECLIYNVVANTYTIKNYHANCGKSFNERHSNHNSSFWKNHTWELKQNDVSYKISRLIVMKAHQCTCGSRKYYLSLCEKVLIARADLGSLLKKDNELCPKCWHE